MVDSKHASNIRWITFDKYINKFGKNGQFENILPFHRNEKQDILSTFEKLVNEHSISPIYDSDIIRNPTIEEIEIIKSILKENGYKLNLKTYQLIKI